MKCLPQNTGLTYEDVLLSPRFSDIRSRSEVEIGNLIAPHYLKVPILSAPMDTVTEGSMAQAMHECGGLGIIHRYNTIEEQIKIVRTILKKRRTSKGVFVGAAVGVTGDYYERAQELINLGVSIICLDIAHAHHILTKEALGFLKRDFPNVHFMVGNVATRRAFADLCNWGADSIKVGIGGGSICSTRLKTGHGVPGLQAIIDCAQANEGNRALLIADGGIKTSGDIVKALAAGADFVMLGSLLAGTDESPGEIFDSEGEKVKIYQGMASSEAQMKWKGKVSSREGISTSIPYRGSVKNIIEDLTVGIRSGFSYSGARNIKELQNKAFFMRQTASGITESATHILLKGNT
jgi:IMP dehydrogenase